MNLLQTLVALQILVALQSLVALQILVSILGLVSRPCPRPLLSSAYFWKKIFYRQMTKFLSRTFTS